MAAAPLPCQPSLPRAHHGCDGRRQRLSGRQSRAAGKFLRARWELATVWQPDEKAALTAQINALFVAAGDPPLYSVRKLEDWLSNARYRARAKQAQRLPSSWSRESRGLARQKHRRRGEPGDDGAATALEVPIIAGSATALEVPIIAGSCQAHDTKSEASQVVQQPAPMWTMSRWFEPRVRASRASVSIFSPPTQSRRAADHGVLQP